GARNPVSGVDGDGGHPAGGHIRRHRPPLPGPKPAHPAASQFCGWRDRVVAIVPEEVGPKESKIIRTLAGGGIEVVHTYNVLDAYGTYARWVTDLALEYGSGDDAIASDTPQPPGMARPVVSAWLMREAGEAQL